MENIPQHTWDKSAATYQGGGDETSGDTSAC